MEEVFEVLGGFLVIPLRKGKPLEEESIWVSGPVLRTFEFIFLTYGIRYDGWYQSEISMTKWIACLDKWEKFCGAKTFDEAFASLCADADAVYPAEYDRIKGFVCDGGDNLWQYEEVRETLDTLLSWTEEHKENCEAVILSDLLI